MLKNIPSEVKIRETPEALTLGQLWAGSKIGKWYFIWFAGMLIWLIPTLILPIAALAKIVILALCVPWTQMLLIRGFGMWFFGDELTWKVLFRNYGHRFFPRILCFFNPFYNLVSYYFFCDCIRELEQIKNKKEIRLRYAALASTCRFPSNILNIFYFFWMLLLVFGLSTTIASIIVTNENSEIDYIFEGLLKSDGISHYIWILSFLFGAGLIQIMRIASLFSCYINSRVWLDGWDISLGFTQLNNRLKQRKQGVCDEF